MFAHSYAAAMQQLADCSPDLIFLSWYLPKTPGTGCLMEIKKSAAHCHIPVLVYSALSQPDDIRACGMHGASFFMEKATTFQQHLVMLTETISMAWYEPGRHAFKTYAEGRYLPFDVQV